MPNKPLVTDAEFEVIEGPYRVGDPHRSKRRKRWLWTGRYRNGVPLWYRPPRFNRWQLAGLGIVAFFAFMLAIYVVALVLDQLRALAA